MFRKLPIVTVALMFLAGCGGGSGGGQAPFTYNPIPGVPAEVNDPGRLIGQQQRNIVTPGGDQANPGFSTLDQEAFDGSNRLEQIVSNVTSSQTFQKGVTSIRTLSATTQAVVFTAYSTPIDPTWAETGIIGDGTTDAGEAVEQEIATALTNAVEAAL
jgi:hypothetical protein